MNAFILRFDHVLTDSGPQFSKSELERPQVLRLNHPGTQRFNLLIRR